MSEKNETKKLIADLKRETASAKKARLKKIEDIAKAKAEAVDEECRKAAIELCRSLVTREYLSAVAEKSQDFYPVFCLSTDVSSLVGKDPSVLNREDIGADAFHVSRELSRRGFQLTILRLEDSNMYDHDLSPEIKIFDEAIVKTPGQYICITWRE